MENIAARAVDKIKLLREFADRKAVEGNVAAVFRTSDVVQLYNIGHDVRPLNQSTYFRTHACSDVGSGALLSLARSRSISAS